MNLARFRTQIILLQSRLFYTTCPFHFDYYYCFLNRIIFGNLTKSLMIFGWTTAFILLDFLNHQKIPQEILRGSSLLKMSPSSRRKFNMTFGVATEAAGYE